MDGIHVPREVAQRAGLPEDLDSGMEGPYVFPDPRRRRIAAAVYLVAGLLAALLLPLSWWVPAIPLLLAVWHLLSAWPLGIDQDRALELAAPLVPFTVGHASAAVTFHGWRSRPRWHVVVYDAAEPPSRRALVVIDAVTGEMVGAPYLEPLE
jgi:hypothetical protein